MRRGLVLMLMLLLLLCVVRAYMYCAHASLTSTLPPPTTTTLQTDNPDLGEAAIARDRSIRSGVFGDVLDGAAANGRSVPFFETRAATYPGKGNTHVLMYTNLQRAVRTSYPGQWAMQRQIATTFGVRGV